MSGRPTYEAEATRRISALGEKAIIAFFREVSPDIRRAVASQLPGISGFRPGTTASVDRQLQALAHRIITFPAPKTFARSTEEIALYCLWCGWGESCLGDSAIVKSLVDTFDQDTSEGNEVAGIDAMRQSLQTLASSRISPREALDRFIAFSPFTSTEALTAIASTAPTSAQMERETALRDLPDRLGKDEALLQTVQARLDGAEQDLRKLRSEIRVTTKTVAALQGSAEQDRATLAAINGTLGRIPDTLSAHESAINALHKNIKSAEDQHGATQRRLADADTDRANFDAALSKLREAVASLQPRGSDTGVQELNDRIVRMDMQLTALAAQIASVGGLAARLEQAETMLLEIADRPVSDGSRAEGLRLTRLALDPAIKVKALATVAEMLASLDAALTDAGLKKSVAASFAEEILAALATEQVVFLRGSYAVDVGRKCALSLCGAHVHRLAIPIGLTDPAALRQGLAERVAKSSSTVAAIVIEGVNNSALDSLRDVLLDQATHRVGSAESVVVFACLLEGDGAFPIDSSYLELGPVFDLEHMEWRRLKREKLPVLGAVSRDAWQTLGAGWESKTVDYEEPLRGVRRFSRRPNARVEANIVRAYSALVALRRAASSITPLQSVTFGWLSPFWSALGAKREEIDAEIDGGKCDGTSIDERLKAFLTDCDGSRSGGSA